MSDEHNPFYCSAYGHPNIHTPGMEQLAEQGTVFRNAYCPSPLCMPSRSAFMAGKPVHALQTYSNCNVNLTTGHTSYGKLLTKAGIHTVYIGKADVYDKVAHLGFSEVHHAGDRRLPGDVNHCRSPLKVREGSNRRAKGYGPKDMAESGSARNVNTAENWLMNNALTIDKPWILIVNTGAPHFPHYCSKDLWDAYKDSEDLPLYGTDEESANHPYAQDLRDHFETDMFKEEDIRGLRRGYLGCVTFVDQLLSGLIKTAEELDILDSTNIIYTSDHGEMLGKFGMWWKCSLYEDSVRVPCIAAGPDFKQGSVVDTPVELHDVQAALFKTGGAERPSEWRGTPLQDIPENDPNRAVFSEYHGHGTRASGYMIRKGTWKYIHCIDAPHQLFNLHEDPDELRNVYENTPDKVQELEQELNSVCDPVKEHNRAEQFITEQLGSIAAEQSE
jgi:choline-sulfatase